MSRPVVRLLLGLLLVGLPSWSAAEPPRSPGGGLPASGPGAGPRPPPRPAEYRFDALRVDGRLHGPERLTVRGMTGGRATPLMRRGRSFLHRIFETLEDPALHAGR